MPVSSFTTTVETGATATTTAAATNKTGRGGGGGDGGNDNRGATTITGDLPGKGGSLGGDRLEQAQIQSASQTMEAAGSRKRASTNPLGLTSRGGRDFASRGSSVARNQPLLGTVAEGRSRTMAARSEQNSGILSSTLSRESPI